MFDRAAFTLGESWRVTACDRRGWGASPAGPDYRRTSIAEQSIGLAPLLRELAGDRQATVAGIGFGGVVALELALAEPDLVARAVMIEPPIYGLLLQATEGMSADVESIRAAAVDSGVAEAYELFLDGRLPVLGAGAERFREFADHGPEAARAFLVELPAVPSWSLDPVRLAGLEAEVMVATCPSTPTLLREAADSITGRIPGCQRIETAAEPAAAPAELLA